MDENNTCGIKRSEECCVQTYHDVSPAKAMQRCAHHTKQQTSAVVAEYQARVKVLHSSLAVNVTNVKISQVCIHDKQTCSVWGLRNERSWKQKLNTVWKLHATSHIDNGWPTLNVINLLSILLSPPAPQPTLTPTPTQGTTRVLRREVSQILEGASSPSFTRENEVSSQSK